ncbi:MAG: hypothetical protein WDA16_01375 [Candidatus Thermoplasmatota archaeon]
MHRVVALAAFVMFVAAAGCTAQGAGTSNFDLKPDGIGWYAGDEAHFFLNITSSVLHSKPSFMIDRQFAIEEIRLVEHGLNFGGDYRTKDPNAIALRLEQAGNVTASSFVLDADHPSLDVFLNTPEKLRDSEYTLELKLFQVGWVKSDRFRVDHAS